eukprot:4228821-Pleurochrysis_carterae.AAC.1
MEFWKRSSCLWPSNLPLPRLICALSSGWPSNTVHGAYPSHTQREWGRAPKLPCGYAPGPLAQQLDRARVPLDSHYLRPWRASAR